MISHLSRSLQILIFTFVKRLDNGKNCLVAIVGGTGCLSKDTIIKGQTQTLEELYSAGKRFIDTISITKAPSRKRGGGYYPKKSKSEIIDSGIKEVFEIELEDGRKIIATKDHKLFKENGSKIVEELVSNLKVGDNLRTYPKDFSDNYFNNAKIKEQDKRDKNYNWEFVCQKCNAIFYREKKGEKKICCKTCSIKKKIKAEKNWFEWEDNILRQFYYSYPKEKLMGLISRSWYGILHRGHRLKLIRNPKFKKEPIIELNKTNNPMNNKKIRDKATKSLNKYYETNSSWNKGIKQWENGNHPKGMLGKHHTEETKDIISKNLSGDKAPGWRGGISFEPYDYCFNERFKKLIRIRDNHCCQICNEEGTLAVHHIDYNKTNTNETNCIALCESCHGKTNYNREYWEQLLSNFLINKYGYLKCMQQKLNQ